MNDGSVVVLILIALAVSNVLPAVLVLASGRVRGQELALWFFAALFGSWLGFIAFMTVTTLDREKRSDLAKHAQLRQSRNLRVLDVSDHSAR